jgi:3-hydroxybutyryl-CoA dehydrogenase
MGHGIAYAAAAAGYRVRVYDPSDEAIARARGDVRSIGRSAIDRGKATAASVDEALERLTFHAQLDATLEGADLVIEAVPEDARLKLALIAEVDRRAPGAIVASNTSSLSVTELAAARAHPARFAGMHFFNPVHKMKLVELVRAADTDEVTLATLAEVAARMGKTTVVVKDSAGFVTSRVNALIGNEAFYMLQEGIASARDIDTALKLGLNHPMGPFELVDLVGLDTRLAVLEYLHRTLGEKYRPCPLLVQHVKDGRLGRKVGRGVYEY